MNEVGEGVLVGQWSYVWAAYILTWATFALYGLRLWLMARKESDHE